MTKNEVLNNIWSRYNINVRARIKGEFLGIHIKKVKPKSIDEWREKITRSNVFELCIPTFNLALSQNYFKSWRDKISEGDIIEFLEKITINHQWQGYKNEMIVKNHFKEEGYTIYDADYRDEVVLGIDFYIVKEWEDRTAISVKSGSFEYEKNKNGPNYKKLKKQITKSNDKVILAIVPFSFVKGTNDIKITVLKK